MTRSSILRHALRSLPVIIALGIVATTGAAQGPNSTNAPPAPPANPPARLQQPRNFPSGVSWNPPAQGFEPNISGEEAYELAWTIEGAPTQPERADALLFLISHPNFGTRRPVWSVTYHGVCTPVFGPPGYWERTPPPDPCGKSTDWWVLIDAQTGEYLMSGS